MHLVLAEGSTRYNPMVYHNGSVWPHNNALITLGLARYGEDVGINVLHRDGEIGVVVEK
ncbi:hypothetical protein [Geothermobacter hydrogeniphilus]|uniref:hypothetical protein n=1 Tax=Geothermobacter hydrogeniphilus TaxID=1969733 RepID=UPI001304DAA7|nr:hypothetical protein [Geothermobacter hydrogeniphilus]